MPNLVASIETRALVVEGGALSLWGLAPGEYVLRLRVEDPTIGRQQTFRLPVEVIES